MKFEFATADRIIFKPGLISEVGNLVSEFGSHAIIVTGSKTERAMPLIETLKNNNIDVTTFSVPDEPTIDLIVDGINLAKSKNCDMVIGFGGGAALDSGKAIAAMINNPDSIMDYLEVIGDNKPLTHMPTPYIAIPTTAGTGSEVTRNAVVTSLKDKVKVSLRSPLMLPRLVIIDPELTYSMPPFITASTGLDALTQVLEPFVTPFFNPLTDGFCREGMKRVARSLKRAYENGQDKEAREDMALASLLGGLALANAKLGGVHGFAGIIGGSFNAPHGVVCAALLPHVINTNINALKLRAPESETLKRYDEIAQILTGLPNATALDGVKWIIDLCKSMDVPGLSRYGLTKEDLPIIIEKSASSSSMKGNPIQLTYEEMEDILSKAL